MKDSESNIHLRPYALYSLMVAIVCTAVMLMLSSFPRMASIQTLAWLETSGLWLILSLAGLAGASAHDAKDVRKPTELLGLATFCIAATTFVLYLVRLGLFIENSQLYASVSIITLALTVVSLAGAMISSVLPTLLRKRSRSLYTIALLSIISTAIATICAVGLLFVVSDTLELTAIITAIFAGMCLLLIPVLRHTMYVHKHIKQQK